MDRGSTEYIQVPITSDASPTTYTVRMAVLPVGQRPVDADWHTATWITIGGVPHAQLLVGPDGGALTLGAGPYVPWVAIDANPEHPIVDGPSLTIT